MVNKCWITGATRIVPFSVWLAEKRIESPKYNQFSPAKWTLLFDPYVETPRKFDFQRISLRGGNGQCVKQTNVYARHRVRTNRWFVFMCTCSTLLRHDQKNIEKWAANPAEWHRDSTHNCRHVHRIKVCESERV